MITVSVHVPDDSDRKVVVEVFNVDDVSDPLEGGWSSSEDRMIIMPGYDRQFVLCDTQYISVQQIPVEMEVE